MATSPLLYAAESWEKVYKAFEEINFTAYDYDAVKQSLIDYLKVHYPENFNDYIESSQFIALVELFAYIAEINSYRVDLSVHENLLPTATRKQSILRLAKLISYTASRNLPLRGLVKINSVSISEDVRDSQGNSLSNRVITWNDQNNPIWREQFFIVMNKVLTQSFGNPFKSFQVDDTIFQQYEISNVLRSEDIKSIFGNGVATFTVSSNGSDLNFELVPADIDQSGVFERSPNPNSYFSLLYANDGSGDSSDTTGFMMYVKQGELLKLPYVFDTNLPNRVIDVNVPNINDVDVWVQEVNAQDIIINQWESVPNVAGTNLAFNNIANTKKYEIETLENDQVRLIFGDGDFAEIPVGIFNIWVRQSSSAAPMLPKTAINNQVVTFLYKSKTGTQESCTFSYSLVSALQNSAQAEDVEHIRSVAPSVYYTQDRMVNGKDYNSLFLKDSSILRMFAVNRTFSGQPKYIDWNDASGQYQNVKIFGDDLRIVYDIKSYAKSSAISSRSIIDEVLEPALSSAGVYNMIVYSYYKTSGALGLAYIKPRTKFIESLTTLVNGFPTLEKTEIQGALDRHWYGEPLRKVMLDANLSDTSSLPKTVYGVVDNDADYRIYDSNLKTVTKDPNTGAYVRVPFPGGVSGIQETVIRQKRFGIRFDPDRTFTSLMSLNPYSTTLANIQSYDFLSSTDLNQNTAREEVYTIEILDSIGNYSVFSSVSGYQAPGISGVPYTNGVISFICGTPHGMSPVYVEGDAFVIQVINDNGTFVPIISRVNLMGRFRVINESDLYDGIESIAFSSNDPVTSWLFIVERIDDENGNPSYWSVINRSFDLIVESSTTKFWYDQDSLLLDNQTKTQVRDMVRVLKSNLDITGTRSIGVDHVYNVVGAAKFASGETNFNALAVTPAITSRELTSVIDSKQLNALEFLRFIGDSDYVYYKKDASTGNLTPIAKTLYIENLSYVNNEAGEYVRKNGRSDLDFMWQHFTPNDHLIDPSTTNIIDMYILTKGYYVQVQDYLKGLTAIEPACPTSIELKNAYRNYIDNKMISDTIILHSGKIKCLFGKHADPELRAKFKIIVSPEAKMTGDQIRANALEVVNDYFRIENWDFGQSFYATELCAVIHKMLATEISSVVLVPEFPTNYFGDLFFIRSAPDEILTSCADLSDMVLIDALDRIQLRQNPAIASNSSACNFMFTPTTVMIDSNQTIKTISVVTNNQTCAWTAISNADWIQLINDSGVGNGSVNYSCSHNDNLSSRTGTIAIQGKIITITQEGVICNFSLSDTSVNVPDHGASGTFTLITSSSKCNWKATSVPSWIQISPKFGVGTSTITFTCDDNLGVQRSGNIVINGITYTVNQAAIVCRYTLPVLSKLFSWRHSSSSFSFTSNSPNCSWIATTNVDWLTISPTSGSGSGTINFSTIGDNSTGVARIGSINVGGQTFTVTQALQGPCAYALTPMAIDVPSTNASSSFTVTTDIECAWTASTSSSWITGLSSGTGSGIVNFSTAANTTGAIRTGIITLGGSSITVTQAANDCTCALSPVRQTVDSLNFGWPIGYIFHITVYSMCPWTYSIDVPWIHVLDYVPNPGVMIPGGAPTNNAYGVTGYDFAYQVESNGGPIRTGHITINGIVFPVTQVTALYANIGNSVDTGTSSGGVVTAG